MSSFGVNILTVLHALRNAHYSILTANKMALLVNPIYDE